VSLRRTYFPPSIPQVYKANFLHLYLDIGWFGILSGSAINFLNIYAARLGASGIQIGMLGGMAAVIGLLLAIPAGNWLVQRDIKKAIFQTSALNRLGYLFWIPLPWIFNQQTQVWGLIALTALMAIPLTPLSVGFNALFAMTVPPEWRAHVAGVRNVVFSIAFICSSLGSGFLLDHLAFPTGYQVVFSIGFLGAAMSSLHLYFIKPLTDTVFHSQPQAGPVIRTRFALQNLPTSLRLDIWKTPFRNTLLVFLGFHFAQYLALPIFPLFQVRTLNLSDHQIGIGTALFYLTVLIGSTQLDYFVRRYGHHKVTSTSVAGLAIYPFFLALSRNPLHFYLTSFIGGLNYALLIGSYANYLLEKIPAADRPAYLAWYNVVLNASIVVGSLGGPLIARAVGLEVALMLIALLRLLSGLAMRKWG
jgi:MFS family permease